MFKHSLISTSDLNTVEKDGKRFYVVGDKEYLSVTSLLSFISEESIKKWKARVGEKKAAEVIQLATSRGQSLHDICEAYLKNENINYDKMMPQTRMRFNDMQNILDEHVNNIKGIEFPLYSDILKLAGRSDCIAEWNGELAILDFKTSNKFKKESWIENYFLQTTSYALMLDERYGMMPKKIVVLITNGFDPIQVFEKSPMNYVKRLKEVLVTYHPDFK